MVFRLEHAEDNSYVFVAIKYFSQFLTYFCETNIKKDRPPSLWYCFCVYCISSYLLIKILHIAVSLSIKRKIKKNMSHIAVFRHASGNILVFLFSLNCLLSITQLAMKKGKGEKKTSDSKLVISTSKNKKKKNIKQIPIFLKLDTQWK